MIDVLFTEDEYKRLIILILNDIEKYSKKIAGLEYGEEREKLLRQMFVSKELLNKLELLKKMPND